MSMSKQDFIALADALREMRPELLLPSDGLLNYSTSHSAVHQWEQDCQAIAAVCKRANYAFKSDRWFAYLNGECGPNGGALKK